MLIGALEAGGTKMVCALGNENGTILEQVSIPTTTPEETVEQIVRYFKDKDIKALGVAAFGPVDVKPQSPTYGRILDTPKLAWRHFDFLGALKKELDVPMGLDTDVNGSCLGEMTYGCAQGLDSAIYITIGTGVGVGVCAGRTPITGATISPRFPSGWRAAAPCGSYCRTKALRRRSCWPMKRLWTSFSAAVRARRANTSSSTSLCQSSTSRRIWIWQTA